MRTIKRLLALIFCVGAALYLINWGYTQVYKILYPVRYMDIVDRAAGEYRLDPYLVYGVIKAESNFIPDAHSGVARGLMQLTDSTAEWVARKMNLEDFSPEQLDDPKTNINMGCFYLRYLIDYYKDQDLALAAYNAGMGNVDSWLSDTAHSKDGKTLDNIPFRETRDYVRRVEEYRQIYQKRYEMLVK